MRRTRCLPSETPTPSHKHQPPADEPAMNTTPHFPIYMDYGATTPVDPRVVDAMIPWLREHFGNPASRSHAWGWEAEAAVEKAREQVADLIGADPREIVWTSGATESDNLAIKGAAHFYKTRGKHLITVKTEHKAVLDTDARSGAPGLRGDLPRRPGGRAAGPGSAEGGHPSRHHPHQRDVRQQRDRRDPGHSRHWRAVPREGRSSSTSTPRRPRARSRSTSRSCRST